MRKKAFLFSAFDWIDLAIRRNRAPGKNASFDGATFLIGWWIRIAVWVDVSGGGGGGVALSVRGGERTRKRYARTVWKAMQKKSRNGHVIFVEKPSPKTNMQRNRPPCATPKRKPHLFVLG